ncbi:MAG: hypothetical protein R3F62_18520 [Planctomycetota bacterium]
MAEVLQPRLQQTPPTGTGWGQSAQHPATRAASTSTSDSGWGAAAVAKPVGVCGACLSPVHEHELGAGAERLSDGRLHCRSCTSQLHAGTICARCYQRFSQAQLRAREVVARQSRAYHKGCIR